MPKSPPPHPELVNAQRFFARLRTFDLECPHCGKVYLLRYDTPTSTWNPRTGLFACLARDGCQRQYVMGVLAWPKGRGHGAGTPPADQVPGPRQLAQLDPQGGGWWMTDEYRHKGRPDPTNLTGEPDRPPEEDATDVDLAISESDEHPRCLGCHSWYNPLKSKATKPDQYCSQTCEEGARK